MCGIPGVPAGIPGIPMVRPPEKEVFPSMMGFHLFYFPFIVLPTGGGRCSYGYFDGQ